jgi:hypothetical protein
LWVRNHAPADNESHDARRDARAHDGGSAEYGSL